VAGPRKPATLNPAASRPAAALRTGKNLPPIAIIVARLFFPQSKSLGIDLGCFSPGLLRKIVYAGSNSPSFQRGSQDLRVLAEVAVPTKQVERLTERIGQERQAERDTAVAAYLARPLTQREDAPLGQTAPPLAVVEMDGGRLQIRADAPPDPTAAVAPSTVPGPTAAAPPASFLSVADAAAAPPAEPDRVAARPAKSKHWREDKVGCLLEMTSVVSGVDPCPEIPVVFVDPLQALKLAQEIGHGAVPSGAPFQRAEPGEEEPTADERRPRPGRPEIACRRVVATRKDVDAFGPLLATAAWSMGLFTATRRAFVADGSSENWTVYKRYFSRWTAVLDFVHALTYVYAAAMAGRTFAAGWPVYERWIQWVWAGQVTGVLEELTARQQELGQPTKEDREGSPRQVVQETFTYLTNQQDKMHYDEYRRQGLPLMSSHVESTVKQINYRVKGTEKFWTEPGAEALLQLRADYLSDNEPLDDFWQRRQTAATGQRRYSRSA
jgi:hypothetical protein